MSLRKTLYPLLNTRSAQEDRKSRLEIEGLLVRDSPEALCCVLELC